MATLGDRILDKVQPNGHGKDYIPADAIEEFNSRDVIEEELKQQRVPVSLVEYILGRPALKIFLILAATRGDRNRTFQNHEPER